MNSIRPLITITVLVVACAFLYVKINESPVRPSAGETEAWNQPPDGVPPLAAPAGTSAAAGSAAPPWPATETPAPTAPLVELDANTASTSPPAVTDALPAVAEVTATQSPAVPAMPAMPEPAATTQADASATASIPGPTDLPANIPTARYPDQPPVNGIDTSANVSATTVPPGSDALGTPPPFASPATPESVNAASAISAEPISPPLATQANPLRQATQPEPMVDPLAPGVSTASQAAVQSGTAVEISFVESWPTIQAALDRGELARAHQLLSRWYDDPSLTPTDAERVESLLNQLAGTVVYSTEHQLAPAHVVKPGETLEAIGKQYNVPWQLLAKINGVTSADQVQAGQELKVVPGPFSAVVDLTRHQLTLMVDGRYAGKFPVTPSPGADLPASEWYVQGKSPVPPVATSRQILLASVDNANAHLQIFGITNAAKPDSTQVAADAQLIQGDAPYLGVSAADAQEIADILSVGSRVVIRR